MLTARPNSPVNAATENSLCLLEAERLALTWDIAPPPFDDVGLIFIFPFLFCALDWPIT
jgi:hypothetical protein